MPGTSAVEHRPSTSSPAAARFEGRKAPGRDTAINTIPTIVAAHTARYWAMANPIAIRLAAGTASHIGRLRVSRMAQHMMEPNEPGEFMVLKVRSPKGTGSPREVIPVSMTLLAHCTSHGVGE